MRDIEDTRLRVVASKHLGAAAARNQGIKVSVGDFIAFLDADDIWTADKLQDQLQALQDNPDAGLAYSWSDYIDEFGRFICSGQRVVA